MKYSPSSRHRCYCIHHLCLRSVMLLCLISLITLMCSWEEVYKNGFGKMFCF